LRVRVVCAWAGDARPGAHNPHPQQAAPVTDPRAARRRLDVRDLVDVHIRAMASPQAAGERFLATGEFR
ncbi:hypothetical protein PV341_43695, partial [Streptomyces sp. PA03-1a]|nr:hypothetical protein [Streptomyces sp. PA03-1a]